MSLRPDICIGQPHGSLCGKPSIVDFGIGPLCGSCVLSVLGTIRNDDDLWLTAGLLGAAEDTILREKRRREGTAKRKASQGYVARVGHLVKIGASVDPENHVSQLGPDAKLLLTYDDGERVERALSRRFKHLRVGGRLYEPDDEMTIWISAQLHAEELDA